MSEIISKSALLILGIIAYEPINPYAVSKLVNFRRTSIRIPTQTVYGIINMFKKRGFVSGKLVKNGNLPDKTIYAITPRGRQYIKKNLTYNLTDPHEVLTRLLLSIMLIGYLDKETALKILKEHQVKTEEAIAVGKGLKNSKKGTDETHIRDISLAYVLKTLQVNHKIVDTLMEKVAAERRWADSPIPWWRDEFLDEKKARKRTRRTVGKVER